MPYPVFSELYDSADFPDVKALFRQGTDVNDLIFVSSSGLKLFWFPNESGQYKQTVSSNS